jgi:hypothetical protein
MSVPALICMSWNLEGYINCLKRSCDKPELRYNILHNGIDSSGNQIFRSFNTIPMNLLKWVYRVIVDQASTSYHQQQQKLQNQKKTKVSIHYSNSKQRFLFLLRHYGITKPELRETEFNRHHMIVSIVFVQVLFYTYPM